MLTINGAVSLNIGPNGKEILLQQSENEYINGNIPQAIFYQTNALYQTSLELYKQATPNTDDKSNSKKSKLASVEALVAEMNAKEMAEFSNNLLVQYVSKSLTKMYKNQELNLKKVRSLPPQDFESCNFLSDTEDPLQGFKKIEEICQQLPPEWTIVQLCKGPRTETTYSVYPKIHEHDAAIYMTLMKHARSHEYANPLCLRLSSPEQVKIYSNFSKIVDRFKDCLKIEGSSVEAKKLYWSLLGQLNSFIESACNDLNNFVYPWTFLFTGISYLPPAASVERQRWTEVDEFCDSLRWEDDARVLLSLAASKVNELSIMQIRDICTHLTDNEMQKTKACNMLERMQEKSVDDGIEGNMTKNYPCILVVDERLDHFFWEEINVHQEFARVNSLQGLWRLYQNYKENIREGYLTVNIEDGGCLINPDKNLQNMESRMSSFFDYWTPHWTKLIGQRPTEDDLFKNYLSRSCYVYAGHGSGLQYIHGRTITKYQLNCVVFLFGCDSSRLHSNGLYSELIGPHIYYQTAMCPAFVGTLMPGLDVNMDKIATEMLSRWIAPKSQNVLPWDEIDETAWAKEFIIKPKHEDKQESIPSMATTPNYNIGSLCAVLARVHQRVREAKLYNTVPYVYRGLPVWNCNAQPLPSAKNSPTQI